jgi:PAS domain S-box-containing protein
MAKHKSEKKPPTRGQHSKTAAQKTRKTPQKSARTARSRDRVLREKHDQLAAETVALTRLAEAGSRLWRMRDLREGLEEMLVAAIELLGADMGNVQTVDPDRGVLVIAAQRGFGQGFLEFFREVSAEDDSACGRALRLGKRTIIEDVEADAGYAPLRPIARAAGYRAVQSTPLIGRDGTPLGMLSTHFRTPHRPSEQDLRRLDLYVNRAVDFIERCKVDNTLQESEARFRLMADNAPVLIWISNTDKLCTWFNQPWLDFVGRPMEKELGNGWAENVHPDDFDQCLRVYTESFDARQPFRMDYRLRRHDGEYRWVHDTGIPLLDPGGTFTGYIGSCIDITELKQAEEELRRHAAVARERESTIRAFLESASQGVLAIDEQGRIVLANKMTERLFGYSPEELVGERLEILLPEELRRRHAQHRVDYFSRPRARPMGLGMDLVGRRKDGTEFPIEVSLSYIDTGKGMLAVSFVSDITERKEVEEKLRALTGQLISAQETESRRLARELHDSFGQRLAVLNMKLSETEAVVSSQPDLAVERLRQMGTELGIVAKDIHQLSRQLHPAVLVQLGLETALENECAAHSQRHDCAVEFSAENIPEHLADEVALCFFRVAQECLQNVSKHAQARAASVTLRGRDHEIVMVIQDRGKGFDVSAIRKGGGLGLTSMEERIRLVNGILSVSSKPGEGTQVEVRIPLGGS